MPPRRARRIAVGEHVSMWLYLFDFAHNLIRKVEAPFGIMR